MCDARRPGSSDDDSPVSRAPDAAYNDRLMGSGSSHSHSAGFDADFGMPVGALGGALMGGALAGLLRGPARAGAGAAPGMLLGSLIGGALGAASSSNSAGGYPSRPGSASYDSPQRGRRVNRGAEIEELLRQIMELQSAGGEGASPGRPHAGGSSLETLPTHSVTAEDVEAAPEEHRACTVCMEDFRAGEEQRTLPCFHRFHKECIDPWLRQSGSCPICKHRSDESG